MSVLPRSAAVIAARLTGHEPNPQREQRDRSGHKAPRSSLTEYPARWIVNSSSFVFTSATEVWGSLNSCEVCVSANVTRPRLRESSELRRHISKLGNGVNVASSPGLGCRDPQLGTAHIRTVTDIDLAFSELDFLVILAGDSLQGIVGR
jgi:hypothetical protein